MKAKLFLISIILTGTLIIPASAQNIPFLEQEVDSLFENLQFGDAVTYLDQLVRHYEKEDNKRKLANTYSRLALAQSSTKSPTVYLSTIELAENIARTHLLSSDSLLEKIMIRKGELLISSGNYDSARKVYQEAFPLAVKHRRWEDAIFCKMGVAVTYFYQKKYPLMEDVLKTALELQLKHYPDSDEMSFMVNGLLSTAYDAYGDFDGAIKLARDGLALQLRNGVDNRTDSNLLATNYNNLGAFYYSKGDYEQAITYYRNAIALKEKLSFKNKETASTYTNLALAFIRSDQLDRALTALEKSTALLKGLPDEDIAEDQIILYNSIARNFIMQGNGNKAIEFARKALSLQELSPAYTYLSLQRIAEAYVLMDQPDRAIPYIERALSGQKDRAFLNDAVLLRLLSEAQLQSSLLLPTLKSSQLALEKLYPQLSKNGFYANPEQSTPVDPLESIRILQQKGKALGAYATLSNEESKYLKQALSTYELSFRWSNDARQTYLNASSKQLLIESTHQAYENAIRISLRLYDLTNEIECLNRAFEMAEQNKAIIMQERFQDNQAKFFAEIPDSLKTKETNIKRDLAFYKQQISNLQFKNDSTDYVKLEFWDAKVLSLNRQLNELTQHYEENFPVYYQLKYELPDITVSDIQNQVLSDSSLLVEFFIGEQHLYIFLLSPHGIEIKSILKPASFAEEVLSLRRVLSSPPRGSAAKTYQQFSTLSESIYRLLMKDWLEKYDMVKHLILIPDQVLSYLPFEVLLTKPADGDSRARYGQLPYLFRQYQIDYSYSARLLLSLNKLENNLLKSPRCLAFAPDFTLSQEFDAIVGNQQELETIRSYFKGRYLMGKDAVEVAFKQHGPAFDIIHLATHGIADKQSPLFSRIAFQTVPHPNEDNLLHTFELYEMLLKARLVVLSACETGFGEFAYGEEVLSLASGFMHTGCHNVTQSLWEAQDQSTAQIMEHYYTYLSQGKTVRAALRLAKLDYLDNPLSQKHPYYWAAFINIGDGRAFVHPQGWANLWWYLLFIIPVIIFLGWRYKSKAQ